MTRKTEGRIEGRTGRAIRNGAAAAALGLGFAMVPATVWAVTPPSPGDAAPEEGFGESWHRYSNWDSRTSPARPSDRSLQQTQVERAKPSRLHILRYSTPLRFGEMDLLFKFRAPGKQQSIVTFEFRF